VSARQLLSSLVALGVALTSLVARAAPVPLSAIPLTDEMTPKAPGKQRITDVRKVDDAFITALDRPVCVSEFDLKHSIFESGGSQVQTDAGALAIERLVAAPESFLERLVIDPKSILPDAKVLRRARVALLQIETAPVPVYAYRTHAAVHIIVPQGFESPADAFGSHGAGREACGYIELALPVTGGVSGGTGQPTRKMTDAERWAVTYDDVGEAEKVRFPRGRSSAAPQWAINASLSKVSRDPEPILSVLVTLPVPDAPATSQ
jgi:hypothetical protein